MDVREPKNSMSGASMPEARSSLDFKGKPIISVTNGKNIGAVEGVMIEPATLKPAALTTAKGSFIRREIDAILAEDIEVWGADVVLVRGSDVLRKKEDMPEFDQWLSVADQLKGRDVITIEGTRLGELSDVVIDSQGNLVSYYLGQTSRDIPANMMEILRAHNHRVPVSATHSLGKDVLIVDLSQLEGVPAEPVQEEAPEPVQETEPETIYDEERIRFVEEPEPRRDVDVREEDISTPTFPPE